MTHNHGKIFQQSDDAGKLAEINRDYIGTIKHGLKGLLVSKRLIKALIENIIAEGHFQMPTHITCFLSWLFATYVNND